MNLNWTKKEFEVYVLLYAAHCNLLETKEETDYILSKVDTVIYNKMHTEIVVEDTTKNVQKIKHYLLTNKYSEKEKRTLLNNIKEVFFADGTVDYSEKKVFAFLKKILS